jgi:hypothetical protein
MEYSFYQLPYIPIAIQSITKPITKSINFQAFSVLRTGARRRAANPKL